ncbi:MAG: DUF481 domain-containing protein [Pseudomonadota bacterium]
MRTLLPLSALALAILFLPSTAGATVNIERYRVSLAEDGASGSLSLGAAAKTGNVRTFEANLSGVAGVRRGPNLLMVVASGKYAAKNTDAAGQGDWSGSVFGDESRWANKLLGAVRYNRDLKPRLAWELFGQVEYDEFLRLDFRTLGGTGPRVALLQQEQASVFLGTGAMAEFERQNATLVAEDADTLAIRWTSYLCFSLQPTETLGLSSTAYIQPRFDRLGDFRLLDETELSLSVTEHLSLGIAFSMRYDSDPAELIADETPLVPLDTELTNKLTLSF